MFAKLQILRVKRTVLKMRASRQRVMFEYHYDMLMELRAKGKLTVEEGFDDWLDMKAHLFILNGSLQSPEAEEHITKGIAACEAFDQLSEQLLQVNLEIRETVWGPWTNETLLRIIKGGKV